MQTQVDYPQSVEVTQARSFGRLRREYWICHLCFVWSHSTFSPGWNPVLHDLQCNLPSEHPIRQRERIEHGLRSFRTFEDSPKVLPGHGKYNISRKIQTAVKTETTI